MHRYIVLLLFILLSTAGLSGCASTDASGDHLADYDFSGIDRVAVVAIEGAGGSEAAQNQVGAMFNQQLMGKGYQPVERAQIREVMEEQDFSQSDATTPEGAAELGEILNVDATLLVNVPEYEEDMSISVQMVDVSDAGIIWTASGNASTGAGLTHKVGAFFGGIGGAAAGGSVEGVPGGVIGGGVGAAGGGLAGKALEPHQQEQAAKLIEEIADTLPDSG